MKPTLEILNTLDRGSVVINRPTLVYNEWP
jgi:hypothetical protein